MNKFAIALSALLLTGYAAQTLAAGDPAAGKQKSTTCAACHGADGNSSSAQFPRLAGQYASYIVQALKEYKSGQRKNAIMKGFASGLSEQDREDLAAYFSSQTGLIAPKLDRRSNVE